MADAGTPGARGGDVARALATAPVQDYLEQLHAELANLNGGAIADYIPELTSPPRRWCAMTEHRR
ncbi:MAG: hypothetical protein GVY09_18315 [Gammaproteobacteria bacterium]|nr:hypothetical protein [Gammaproteobacteria bacterium]